MRYYRPTYTTGGIVHQSRRWWLDFCDHRGLRRRLAGLPDRRAAEALGRTVQQLIACAAADEPPPPALARRLTTLPVKILAALHDIGLAAGAGRAARRPLEEHLAGSPEAPGFREHLVARGADQPYVRQAVGRVRRIILGCGFRRWQDISGGKVMTFLHGLRQTGPAVAGSSRRGLGAASVNGYLRAFKTFCRWLADEGLAPSSPVMHLRGVNERVDRRHERRALSPAEVYWLLRVTPCGPDCLGMPGPRRALLYRLAVETGLRAGELASLTTGSFCLDGQPPTVTVEAAYSKHRRRDTLPLRAALTAVLQPFLASLAPAAQVFPELPVGRLAKMFRADLAAARRTWLNEAAQAERRERQESDLLRYIDAQGRHCDFHSLRHTCASLLAAAGAHPKVAQLHMRLSSVELTLGRYTHVLAGQHEAALAALPEFAAAG